MAKKEPAAKKPRWTKKQIAATNAAAKLRGEIDVLQTAACIVRRESGGERTETERRLRQLGKHLTNRATRILKEAH